MTHFHRHSDSGEPNSWKLQSIRRSLCPQKCYTASIKYNQLRILKIAICFIVYIPKLTKEKHISRLLYKSILKEFSTSDNNQSIEQNPVSVRDSVIESDFLLQKVNRNDKMMVQGTLIQYIYRC
jgi:hypothetical protein